MLNCSRENRDRIDGIIVSLPNFGFEIGIINAISVADLNVPVLVQACDDENDKGWIWIAVVTRSVVRFPYAITCISMAFLLLILPFIPLHPFILICWQPISINLLRSAVVNGLRHARIGAIGTRPAGFQTVRASEKLLQASGITVVPVDLSEILSAARKIEDADETLQAKLKEIRPICCCSRTIQ